MYLGSESNLSYHNLGKGPLKKILPIISCTHVCESRQHITPRKHLTPTQFHPWPVQRQEHLGQGPLCQGCQAHRLHPRHGVQGAREIRLFPRDLIWACRWIW